MRAIEFSTQELNFICGMMEVELGWGPSVYSQSELKLINSIMRKTALTEAEKNEINQHDPMDDYAAEYYVDKAELSRKR